VLLNKWETKPAHKGVIMCVRGLDFSSLPPCQTGSGAHSASYPMVTEGSFPGVKRPDRQADHSPPSSVEVKNARSFALPIRPNGVVLRYRDNFHSPKG